MSYQTVFDITQAGFPWNIVAFVALVVFAVEAFALFMVFALPKRKTNAKRYNWVILLLILAAGPCVMLMLFAPGYFSYANYQAALKEGRARVVEGRITQLQTLPRSESFTVGGVLFEYGAQDSRPGFHQTRAAGGPIQQGLNVKIHYVPDPARADNVILKLEIQPTGS